MDQQAGLVANTLLVAGCDSSRAGSRRALVRQTMALWIARPVARSQTIVV